MKSYTENTHRCNIYASGPISEAEQVIRKYCKDEGLCVTISPTKFIYSFGEEQGYVVGVINYPRFPKSEADVWVTASTLAKNLIDETHQGSILIETQSKTQWITIRDDNK